MSDTALVAREIISILTVEVEGAPDALVATQEVARLFVVAGQGPAGRDGGALVVRQTTPSASWAIPHVLGRPPAVQVFLASGEAVIADIVSTDTAVSVAFASPTAGFAVLN